MWESPLPTPNLPSTRCRSYNCGRKNHFSKVCRSRAPTKQRKKIHAVAQHDSSDSSDDLFIDMVQCGTYKTPDWKVKILINGQETSFKIDTGAQCNVLSMQKYNQLSFVL